MSGLILDINFLKLDAARKKPNGDVINEAMSTLAI
jgi:hypothetical protein